MSSTLATKKLFLYWNQVVRNFIAGTVTALRRTFSSNRGKNDNAGDIDYFHVFVAKDIAIHMGARVAIRCNCNFTV